MVCCCSARHKQGQKRSRERESVCVCVRVLIHRPPRSHDATPHLARARLLRPFLLTSASPTVRMRDPMRAREVPVLKVVHRKQHSARRSKRTGGGDNDNDDDDDDDDVDVVGLVPESALQKQQARHDDDDGDDGDDVGGEKARGRERSEAGEHPSGQASVMSQPVPVKIKTKKKKKAKKKAKKKQKKTKKQTGDDEGDGVTGDKQPKKPGAAAGSSGQQLVDPASRRLERHSTATAVDTSFDNELPPIGRRFVCVSERVCVCKSVTSISLSLPLFVCLSVCLAPSHAHTHSHTHTHTLSLSLCVSLSLSLSLSLCLSLSVSPSLSLSLSLSVSLFPRQFLSDAMSENHQKHSETCV